MGKFKMQSPIKLDPVPRYEVPFLPDNIEDNSGLVAKANKNGTMIVNKNIPKNSRLYKEAKSHEDHHLYDMFNNKLDYDDQAVYHNIDGKGVQIAMRTNFDESDRNLPWEKGAYKAGENLEEKDMRPNPNKLDKPPSMKEDNPLAYYKIGSKKPFRSSDMSSVDMNERFGNAMIKRFGGPSKVGGPGGPGTDPSGTSEEEKTLEEKAKQKANEELAKMEYQSETLDDGTVRYFKSAEGSATDEGSSIVAAGGGAQTKDADSYIANLKKRFPDATGQELVDKGYISSSYKDQFPSAKTATATATDEYFEKVPGPPPPPITPPETPPDTPTYTTTEILDKKKKKRNFNLNLGNRPKGRKLKQKLETTKDTGECRVDDKRSFCLADMFDGNKQMSRRKVQRKARRQQRKFRRRGGRY